MCKKHDLQIFRTKKHEDLHKSNTMMTNRKD
jgi:hypothetical protein